MTAMKLCVNRDCAADLDHRWRADTALIYCPRCDEELQPCEECGNCGKHITDSEERQKACGGGDEPPGWEPACVFCLPDDQREREQAARDAAYERRLDEARENGWA